MEEKNLSEYEKNILKILIKKAKERETIYYSSVTNEIGGSPRNLGKPLGKIGDYLKAKGKSIPNIQALVVRKDTGMPGSGIKDFIDLDEKLSKNEEKEKFKEIWEEIYNYDWSKIIEELGIYDYDEIKEKIDESITSIGRGGGEGPCHKELKEYVFNNPCVIDIIDIKENICEKQCEKRLPSGDSVDVYFETKDKIISIEIKSHKSDHNDIIRGLFQCVKYGEVIKKWQLCEDKKKEVLSILVLGGEFPKEILDIKDILKIQVIDNIKIE